MCFNCGLSNSVYKWDSRVEKGTSRWATIDRHVLFDEDREIVWFPSVLNMGKFGVIYPKGTQIIGYTTTSWITMI